MPLKEVNVSSVKDPQAKYSSVMYKTTFSSQAKDVRRVGSHRPTADKENLPRGFEVAQNQAAVRRQFSRKSRLTTASKKPIDVMIAGLRRCFKDSEEGGDEYNEPVDDATEQIDILCTEIAALKAHSDPHDVCDAATHENKVQDQGQLPRLSRDIHDTSTATSADASSAFQPVSRKNHLSHRSHSPPNWEPGQQSSTGRQSPSCPPLHLPCRDSSNALSPRSLHIEEVRGGRSSPRVRPTVNKPSVAHLEISKPSAELDTGRLRSSIERISPGKQRPTPPAIKPSRRAAPPSNPLAEHHSPTSSELAGEPTTLAMEALVRKQSAESAPPITALAESLPEVTPPVGVMGIVEKVATLPPRPRNRTPSASHRETIPPMDLEVDQTAAAAAAAGSESLPPPGLVDTIVDYSSPPPQDCSSESSSSVESLGENPEEPDSRKRKVTEVDQLPRRARRLSEALPSPPRGERSSPSPLLAEENVQELVIKIPRSPSPACEFTNCPSPPLVGPYSPPAARQRRYSLSTPPSPVPQLCLSTFPHLSLEHPIVSEGDLKRLAEHEEWFQAQLQSFTTCVPNRGGVTDPDFGDPETSDEDSEPECHGTSNANGCPPAPAINSKYFNELYSRFEECKRLNHLPALNLCFTLLDTLLLLGNKKTLTVLLRKNNLPKLLAAMQYNPKFNCLLDCRADYLDTMGKRLVAIPLPPTIAELAVTVYQLLFLKDTIIPVVCDEARYMNLNLHVVNAKSKLCQMVFDDRRLLPQLFSELRSGTMSPASTLDYLRFLKEFLELGITSYPGDGSYFWRGMLRDHQLVPILTEFLGEKDQNLRRAAIDICLLLCDEESRKILYSIIPQHPLFLRRLFDVFCDTESSEATVLQLQATLPMLVASPHAEALPVFYDSAQQVLDHWLEGWRHGQLPQQSHISAFMELLSLAIHHHHRTFHYSHEGCVITLIEFSAVLWNQCPGISQSVLIAVNKGILSILHISHEMFHQYLAEREVFRGMLQIFNDGNNLMTSSMLTLLHTILQLDLQSLVKHICTLWFGGPTVPHYRSLSFVQQLFLDRQKMAPVTSIYA